MPHVEGYRLDGALIPSVSECTASLGGKGLIDNFYRRYGFKKADEISKAARVKGSDVAGDMESFRKKSERPTNPFAARCAANWYDWYVKHPYTINSETEVECHLVNVPERYHGSPDMLMLDVAPDSRVLGDDKVKKRFADYALLMAEHAYAMCTHLDLGGKLIAVPWKIPIKTILFFTYHPVTAQLYPHEHHFDHGVYEDFLVCRSMVDVNARSEAYFKENAVVLPEDDREPKKG